MLFVLMLKSLQLELFSFYNLSGIHRACRLSRDQEYARPSGRGGDHEASRSKRDFILVFRCAADLKHQPPKSLHQACLLLMNRPMK